MEPNKNLHPLLREMESLKEEVKKSNKINDELKKKFSSEIKMFKPSEIKNTISETKKLTLWERIKKALGMT